MNRRPFPAKVMLAAFERAKDHCESCTARLVTGKFQYDHRIPDAMGGEPTLENCEVLCTSCHSGKTRLGDIPAIAKVKRIRAKHAGIKKATGRPMDGTRRSPFKAKIGGGWERRT